VRQKGTTFRSLHLSKLCLHGCQRSFGLKARRKNEKGSKVAAPVSDMEVQQDSEMQEWLTEAVASYNNSSKKLIAKDSSEWEVCETLCLVEPSGKITLRNKDGKTLETYYKLKNSSRGSSNQAIAWARSLKYPIPDPPNSCLNGIVTICGFVLGIIPGIIWVIYIGKQKRDYQKRIEMLNDKWVDAGKPAPGILTNIMNPQATQVGGESTNGNLEEKIQRIKELKEKELISEDEYLQMRLHAFNEFADGK